MGTKKDGATLDHTRTTIGAGTLARLLDTIESPHLTEVGIQYHVKSVPGFDSHYFGRTSSGNICLLLSTLDSSIRSPIKLSAIEVSFAVPCKVVAPGDKDRIESMTAIVCSGSNQVMQGYFTHVCEMLLNIVGRTPSLQMVTEAVQHLVDLFQRLSNPARRSVIGLFGELYLIYVSESPATALNAWRSAIDDRFDFSIGDVRLEVKTSGTRQRSHDFSLEQCTPPPDTYGVLVSMFIESSGGGMSLLDLIERIDDRLDGNTDLLMKLHETVAEGLGTDASKALSMRFDDSLTKSSLRVYTLDSIPRIRESLPTTISQVRFRSDLSQVATADIAELTSSNSKLGSLMPQWLTHK